MMTDNELNDIKDNHLMGPEEDYSDIEYDVNSLVKEVELLKAYLEVADEEKINLIKEVESARRTFTRLVGNFLRNVQAEDLTEVETRLAVLTRLAVAAKAVTDLDRSIDFDLGAFTIKGLDAMSELFNNIDAIDALSIPLELEISGKRNRD